MLISSLSIRYTDTNRNMLLCGCVCIPVHGISHSLDSFSAQAESELQFSPFTQAELCYFLVMMSLNKTLKRKNAMTNFICQIRFGFDFCECHRNSNISVGVIVVMHCIKLALSFSLSLCRFHQHQLIKIVQIKFY